MTATSQHTARVELTVGQVAESFGVTVRTLHHYDAEGLVVPSARTPAGYRLYTDADLSRLASVVTYRRLGLPLSEVRALLDGEGTPEEHLRRQRDAVLTRLGELEQLVTAIDRALEATMDERPATTDELKELFGDGFSEEYQAEAQERWGDTDAWKQSQSRTSRYTKEDWQAIKAEMDAIHGRLAALLRAGEPAVGAAAMDAAEEHRAHITRWFYDCPPAMHASIAEMYVSDPRFTATYEDIETGLAVYVRDAVAANAVRQE
jgi:MerR family transcriptional regulator, thiopeptide resistance regulator